MPRLLALTAIIFVGCVLSLLIGIGWNATPSAFIQALMNDSQLVDGQWTWREIHPGRDTMKYAVDLLQRIGDDGLSQQIRMQQDPMYVDWTMLSDSTIRGSVLTDHDQTLPHVFAILITPPSDALKLGDALLLYGAPIDLLNRQSVCFARGVCVSVVGSEHSGRLSPTDRISMITYIVASDSERTDYTWRGFRRY